MAYTLNIPLATDLQSVSQSQILNNFTQLNTSFGIDHYPFTTAGANTGFHNVVTNPIITPQAHPTTGVHITKFYSNFETQVGSTRTVGPIQYSRGENNAVPSPVTTIQSTANPITLAASGVTLTVDFTGLARAIATLYSMDTSFSGSVTQVCSVFWNGTTFVLQPMTSGGNLVAFNGGSGKLQVKNTSGVTLNNVYWTLTLQRLS